MLFCVIQIVRSIHGYQQNTSEGKLHAYQFITIDVNKTFSTECEESTLNVHFATAKPIFTHGNKNIQIIT